VSDMLAAIHANFLTNLPCLMFFLQTLIRHAPGKSRNGVVPHSLHPYCLERPTRLLQMASNDHSCNGSRPHLSAVPIEDKGTSLYGISYTHFRNCSLRGQSTRAYPSWECLQAKLSRFYSLDMQRCPYKTSPVFCPIYHFLRRVLYIASLRDSIFNHGHSGSVNDC
jgi:hypothetical protein